ncbi:ABC transporter permease [Agromyces sp. PvR057]|uniref:ABC transporter permease n=1 Tax=Agromyces sp. PvR057 TaxID=3156403 RepID=UPI000E23BD84
MRTNGPGRDDLRRAVALTWTLAMREVRAQYNKTVLGRAWSLISPLVTIAVYSVVFGLIFAGEAPEGINSGIQNFALWIAVGVVSWTFISGAIGVGMSSLLSNSGLLTKVYFPRAVLVVSAIIATIVTFLTELLVVVVIMAFVGGPRVLLGIPVLLVFVLLAAIFCTGVGLLLSIGVVWFRDIEYLWGLFSQVWMYASGVVFPITLVAQASIRLYESGVSINGEPIPLLAIFRLNPAEQFLEAFRAIIYHFVTPPPGVWLSCTLWAFGALAVGALVFRAKQSRVVEEL